MPTGNESNSESVAGGGGGGGGVAGSLTKLIQAPFEEDERKQNIHTIRSSRKKKSTTSIYEYVSEVRSGNWTVIPSINVLLD